MGAAARLTREYLRNLPAGCAPERTCAGSPLAGDIYGDAFLTRPVLLGHGESREVGERISRLYDLLLTLPERRYGGDLRAFTAALGWPPEQIAAALRADGGPRELPRSARADLYREADGFRLLELNGGSPLGGWDIALLNRTLLQEPYVASFVTEHGLGFTDGIEVLLDLWRQSFPGFDPAANPVVALLEWPGSYPAMERHLSRTAALLAEHGVDAVPCHLGQVEYRPDGVHVAGRRVDLVHRWFVINDVVTAEDAALLAPLSRAADRGLVHLFTPLENEVYGSKAALALLSDTRDRSLFDRAEREVIDALLPWTRLVRDERTEVAGERVELLRYATAHRDELVLKASSSHSGLDVLAGWETPADTWADAVRAAVDGPYILQRRVRPVPEEFPVPGGGATEPVVLTWGVFLAGRGYGGAYLRGTADLDSGVISSGKGGRLGTAFLVDDSRPPAP
ncbi:hypothetical protein G6W57_05365 [Streptomyces sp. CAI-121]|uniref:hypothetical protein n=1 Tax=unclassified Streptomyces TaxID=2593676 RepID=UPI001587131B|nr:MULTISPECIES: hypothetical protein [unclassified Streptomyces]NUV66541.1 hypothetical protein [Streptomyces sp. CAI-121]NUW11777.1 hypothetical protein [Streptomyces sp. CAI-68]